ncbi:MAG TPA: tetratricopeptide repeat protein [Acidisoma sp.]|jgi:tetratricopeptide (TPR) repeat protein|uniref:tetratricopeptide repeat protein n=1 Tax=Acidisoma sp. TaxID=1872115 RepID=UPI002C56028D|nr:tetratricopeptide repeat protein [Acidisoma sp.]HTI00956.1 tetratricopeptide repeat protein [Acidisoma sp.]
MAKGSGTALAPDVAQEAEPLFRDAIRLLQAGDAGAASLLPRLEAFAAYAPGWLALGEVLRDRGQRVAAVLAFRRAAAAGEVPALLHRAGQGLAALGQGKAAEAAFRAALDLDADFAPAWYSLGLSLQDSRDFTAAAEAFGRALAGKPDFHEAAFNQGVVLQEAGQMEAALAAYAEAYKLRPESFGRIAQALVASPQGALWLKPSALRAVLSGGGC